MMAWNPWSVFDELERIHWGSSQWPQFEIDDSDDETLLSADVPGMTEDDIELTVQMPYLIVRGERKHKRGNRSFARRFYIGDAYDVDDVKAHLQDGVLTIRLAKAARAKPRRIKLTSGVVEKVKGLLTGTKAA